MWNRTQCWGPRISCCGDAEVLAMTVLGKSQLYLIVSRNLFLRSVRTGRGAVA